LPSAERTRPKFGPKAAPERRENPGNTEKSPKVPMTSRTDRGLRNQLSPPVEHGGSCTSGAHGSRRRTAARKHRGQSKPWPWFRMSLASFTNYRPTIKRFRIHVQARVLRPWYFFQRTRPTTAASATQKSSQNLQGCRTWEQLKHFASSTNCTKRSGMSNAEVFLRIFRPLKSESELGHLLGGPAAFELSWRVSDDVRVSLAAGSSTAAGAWPSQAYCFHGPVGCSRTWSQSTTSRREGSVRPGAGASCRARGGGGGGYWEKRDRGKRRWPGTPAQHF
jgi:hypothetical protein